MLWQQDRVHVDTFWEDKQVLFGVVTDLATGGLFMLETKAGIDGEKNVFGSWPAIVHHWRLQRYPHEEKSVSALFRRDVSDFANFISNNELLDLKLKGPRLTWSNGGPGKGTLFKRLDRCLISESWLESFPNALLENMSRSSSDHCPLLLHLDL